MVENVAKEIRQKHKKFGSRLPHTHPPAEECRLGLIKVS
jgi:hypothetical protein